MNVSSWNYMFWLLAFIWAPAAVFWAINLGGVRGHLRATIIGALVIAVLCLPTEYWIDREILILPPEHNLGLHWLGMPLEDYLFFVSFPFLVTPVALKLESLMGEDGSCQEN